MNGNVMSRNPRKEKKTLTPRVSLGAAGSGHERVGVHHVYEHLHFDIQRCLSAEEVELVNNFADTCVAAGLPQLRWENFVRLDYQQVVSEYGRRSLAIADSAARVISEEDLFGAPEAHLTAKYSGPHIGPERDRFTELFERSIELLDRLDVPGYLERELVSYRAQWPPDRGQLTPPSAGTERSKYSGLTALPMIDLQEVDRIFRTTEIHISFSPMADVAPHVLEMLYAAGFYSAFKWERDEGVTAIATIQGFEAEIYRLLVKMESWLEKQMVGGGIRCETVLKKEDIVSFYVFGDNPGIQRVVEPGASP